MVASVQAGIDEAGRGPVVGPLVVALVADEDPRRIARLGVQDSKTLSPKRREELDAKIRAKAAHVEVIEVGPTDLDARMLRQSLNRVEVEIFAELGRRVRADRYYLDACDVVEARFGREFLVLLDRGDAPPEVVSEHRADGRYALVKAASIVAKVHRDRCIAQVAARLEPQVGLPLGSGYSHDVTTRTFLEKYLEIHGVLPSEARAVWATSKGMVAARQQRSLEAFAAPAEPGTRPTASRSPT